MTTDNNTKLVCGKVQFGELCKALDACCKSRKPAGRREVLQRFVETWRGWHLQLHGPNNKTEDSMFPAMRLILPSLDKDRGAYGIKEHLLAVKMIDRLGMDKSAPDAQRLLKSNVSSNYATGDFGSIVEDVLRTRIGVKSTRALTIRQINDHLDALALGHAEKDKKKVDRHLLELLKCCSASEMKWLTRIIMKQMKLGISEVTILKLYHPDAVQLFDVSTSLSKVCRLLHDPTKKLDQVQVELFSPFRPMLAYRSQPEKVTNIMKQPFLLEVKYDGERVQLHKDGQQYRFFSRNGNDWTASYGANKDSGSFTPYIHGCFADNVQSCILDGEMVGWYADAECIASKGENFDVKSLVDGENIQPCFVPFDCLLLNGQVLTQEPLRTRLQQLDASIRPVEGRLIKAVHRDGITEQDVVDALNDAIEKREEGLIVKRPDSTYRLNTRSPDAGWLKIKPDYIDALMDDLDLLIVGGYFGEGRRRKVISHFLLAVAEPVTQPGDVPTKFLSCCKVGSGYSMKELYEMNLKLVKTGAATPFPKKTPPAWLELSVERPDVVINPKQSYIVQVRAAEITPSRNFATGYTPRFPRVEKIRNDKSWSECMTTDEFHQLRQDTAGRLAKARLEVVTAESTDQSPAKKRRIAAARKEAQKPVLAAQFQAADLSTVVKISEMLAGKEFCVVNGPNPEYSKQNLEKAVAKLGGSLVQHPGKTTHAIIAAKVTMKVTNALKSGDIDVVNSDWLIRCVRNRRYMPWLPSDMLGCSPETKASFSANFDKFGDSYIHPIAPEQLRQLLSTIKSPEPLASETLADLKHELLQNSPFHIFLNCGLYIGQYDQYLLEREVPANGKHPDAVEYSVFVKKQLIPQLFRMYGGSIVADVDQATHLLVDEVSPQQIAAFKLMNRSQTVKFHLISGAWIRSCVKARRRLDERTS